MKAARCIAALWPLLWSSTASAKEDVEFTAEHLPEVGVDNRYATLPVWGTSGESQPWSVVGQLGHTSAGSGTLQVRGPMFSAAVRRELSARWSLGLFAFYDVFQLRSGREQRELQTLFAPDTPISRPAAAVFTGLNGTSVDRGLGLHAALHSDRGWLGEHRWVAGVLWQQIRLHDYRFDYQVLAGPSSGVSGQLDFDAEYHNAAPFVGLEVLRHYGNWNVAPHVLYALPIPRQGFAGHITGPGFELSGDSGTAGNGKHFGDSSLTLGLQVTYRPARLSIDLGTVLSQALLVPLNKRGITHNVIVSVHWLY
jgi:hypothetical protein